MSYILILWKCNIYICSVNSVVKWFKHDIIWHDTCILKCIYLTYPLNHEHGCDVFQYSLYWPCLHTGWMWFLLSLHCGKLIVLIYAHQWLWSSNVAVWEGTVFLVCVQEFLYWIWICPNCFQFFKPSCNFPTFSNLFPMFIQFLSKSPNLFPNKT